MSVTNSNSIPILFKQASHANPGADKNEQGQIHVY